MVEEEEEHSLVLCSSRATNGPGENRILRMGPLLHGVAVLLEDQERSRGRGPA